jgi:hypothetical protein
MDSDPYAIEPGGTIVIRPGTIHVVTRISHFLMPDSEEPILPYHGLLQSSRAFPIGATGAPIRRSNEERIAASTVAL